MRWNDYGHIDIGPYFLSVYKDGTDWKWSVYLSSAKLGLKQCNIELKTGKQPTKKHAVEYAESWFEEHVESVVDDLRRHNRLD